MNVIFSLYKREMRDNLKGLLGWSLGILVLTVVGFIKYEAVLDPSINNLMANWPRVAVVLFTGGFTDFSEVPDYYGIMYSYLVLLVACHAALLGGNILSKEERDKTSEFLFVKPISRVNIVTGKLLAALTNIVIVLAVCYAGTVSSFGSFADKVNFMPRINELALGMFLVQLMFLLIGMGLSGLVSNNRRATTAAGISVLAAFFIAKFIQMSEKIYFLNFLSPLQYFEPSAVYKNGIEWYYVLLAVLIVACMGAVTYVSYQRRDLRV